jgi:quercetin dioxygenase-like cupin family protein
MKIRCEVIPAPQTATNAGLLAKLAHGTVDAPLVAGRRTFFQYRDLGVSDATNGQMRAQVTSATGVMQETGWHYHVCETQFIYTLRGWIDLQFEDGRIVRVGAGESLFIPPGLKHNETAISEDFEFLEISVPAKMGTVVCDAPEDIIRA